MSSKFFNLLLCFSARMSSKAAASVRHNLQEALREGAGEELRGGGEGELCAKV